MNNYLNKIDNFLEELFLKKLPPLSQKARKLIDQAVPWLVLIFGLLTVPGLLAYLGFGGLAALFGNHNRSFSLNLALNFLLSLAVVVLQLAAVPKLLKHSLKGWNLLFYLSFLGGILNLLSLNIVGFFLSTFCLYLLYQIKRFYK